MEERRSKVFSKTEFTFPFLILSMAGVLLFTIIGFSLLLSYIGIIQGLLHYPFRWKLNLIIFLLGLVAAIILIFCVVFIILRRSLGAIPRIEKTLDRIIKGDHSLRITIRKKDIIHSFVDKLNELLGLLEKKPKD
jgi:signal transduction histidine kinase